ncbi:hypothetical protein ACWDBD_40115 [Streptomyces sp. NPDC001118]
MPFRVRVAQVASHFDALRVARTGCGVVSSLRRVPDELPHEGRRIRLENPHLPEIPARELALYARAVETLRGMNVPVVVLDTGRATPSEGAAQIASSITRRPGSVGPSDPDSLTVTR